MLAMLFLTADYSMWHNEQNFVETGL